MSTPHHHPQSCARLTKVGWDSDLVYEADAGPKPEPAPDQVLVEVEACGVCFRDCIDRSGRFPFIRTPVTPGHEAVGRVLAVGSNVTAWSPGDRVATMHRDSCGVCAMCKRGEKSLCNGAYWVFGIMADGGYARYLLAPETAFYRMSEAIPAPQAAVLHCTFGTAWRGLNQFGRPKAGDRVLVTGANGGVGAAAIQLASRLGALVTAVVRSDAHDAFLKELGAEQIIVDDGTSFHKKMSGKKADLVLDCVGQPTFNASVRALRMGGGLVVIGNVVKDKAELNLGYLIVNGLRMVGSSGALPSDMAEVVALYEAEPLNIPIDRELGLDKADEAQRAVMKGGLQGRIVLVP